MSSSTGLTPYTFEEGRIYTDHDDLWLPSVSFVLGVRDTPPGLRKYFKNTTQSEQDEKTFYTQNRGTLIHYHLIDELVDREMWSDDEQNSKDCLKGKRVHEDTGLTGGYETWSRFQSDLEWARSVWPLIRRIHGISTESMLGAELAVFNTDVGYAGRFDMLYADENGDVVLADIKTSKRVYDKHILQCVAYKHAVNISVDRMEVIRMNPDSQTWEVSRSDEWVEDDAELWSEFCELRDTFEDEKIEELKQRIQNDDGQ